MRRETNGSMVAGCRNLEIGLNLVVGSNAFSVWAGQAMERRLKERGGFLPYPIRFSRHGMAEGREP
jgi:hypothetical protein